MRGKEKLLKYLVFSLLLAVLAGCALNRAPVRKTLAGLFSGMDAAIQTQERETAENTSALPGASTARQPQHSEEAAGERKSVPVAEPPENTQTAEAPGAGRSKITPEAKTQNEAQTFPANTAPQKAPARAAAGNKATALFSGLPQRDKLITDKEIKYYTISVPERGSLRMTIASAKKNDMSSRLVSVYQTYYLNGSDGEKGTRLLHTMTAYTNEASNDSINIGVGAGDYIITVSAGYYADLSMYELTVTFTPGTAYEIEYNNTAARYTEIYSGVQIRGNASVLENGTDRDWYMIRMHTAGALRILFEHKTNELVSAAFKLTLYDNKMTELYSDVSTHDLAVLESGSLGIPSGCYFLCVEGRVWFNGDYGLTVTKSVADIYEKENNDTRASATQLESGRGITGALTSRDESPDLDYYTFTVPDDGRVSVILSVDSLPETDDGDSDKYFRRMTLTDEKGRVLYRGLQAQTEKMLQTGSLGLQAGRYYLLVDHDGLDEDHGDYLLRYSFAAIGGWEKEPNDQIENASLLPFGTLCSGSLSDRGTDFDTDWYVFTLEIDCRVTLTLTHGANDTEAAVYVLRLQNVGGSPCCDEAGRYAVESRGGEGRTDAAYVLQAGTYYLQLKTGTFADHGVYSLLLNYGEA